MFERNTRKKEGTTFFSGKNEKKKKIKRGPKRYFPRRLKKCSFLKEMLQEILKQLRTKKSDFEQPWDVMNDHLLRYDDHDDLLDLGHGHVPEDRWDDISLNQLSCHLRHSFTSRSTSRRTPWRCPSSVSVGLCTCQLQPFEHCGGGPRTRLVSPPRALASVPATPGAGCAAVCSVAFTVHGNRHCLERNVNNNDPRMSTTAFQAS